MTKRRLVLAGVIILIVGFIAYRFFTSRAKKEQVVQAQVMRGNVEETLTISGEIEADQEVSLHFQTGGKLAWVGVKEGDRVEKNQMIAQLDRQDLQKRLQKTLNTFVKIRTDFDQTKDDYDDKALTDAIKRTIDKSQFDLNNAVLDVELQHLSVDLATLTSPISGIVVKADPSYAGVNVTAIGAEYQILNPTTLYFEVLPDQIEVVTLREGMMGSLYLDAYPDEQVNGMISRISFTPKADETSTVYPVRFVFSTLMNGSVKYRVGMTGDLTFTTRAKQNVLYIPSSFLKEENGNRFVLVDQGGKHIRVEVRTGIEGDEVIEIISGVSEGDVVYD